MTCHRSKFMVAARIAVFCVLTAFVTPVVHAAVGNAAFPDVTESDPAVIDPVTVTVELTTHPFAQGGTEFLTVFFDHEELSVTFASPPHTASRIVSCGRGCVQSGFVSSNRPVAERDNIVIIYRARRDHRTEAIDPSPTLITVAHTDYFASADFSTVLATERVFMINVYNGPAPPPSLELFPVTLTVLGEGATETVEVNLAAEPSADVTVAVAVSDPSELTVNPASLVFSSTNWNAVQTFVLTGVEDNLVDGTQAVVVTYAVSSDDTGYDPMLNVTWPLDVTDVPALVLDPPSLLNLAEGDTSQVMVKLAKRPDARVIVEISSSDIGELLVSPASSFFHVLHLGHAAARDAVGRGGQRG